MLFCSRVNNVIKVMIKRGKEKEKRKEKRDDWISGGGEQGERRGIEAAMGGLSCHRRNVVDLGRDRDLLPIHRRQATHGRG